MLGKHQLISILYLQLSLTQILPMMQCISSFRDLQANGACEKFHLSFPNRAWGGKCNQEIPEDAEYGVDG